MKAVTSSPVKGTVAAPPSKSAMIRAVGASLLASGLSRIQEPSYCDDALSALNAADALGAMIYMEPGYVGIKGNGSLGERPIRNTTIQCGESGLCMRMFAPIAGLVDQHVTIEGSGSLLKRPMTMVEILTGLGGECQTRNGYPPLRIKGPIRGGVVALDGSESSQLLTGLLMALPLCSENSTIEVAHLKSKPYVEMTLDTLSQFGVEVSHDENLTIFQIPGGQRYAPRVCTIEGDWSGAAFLLVAGAIAGEVEVTGLLGNSSQADKAILLALEAVGAEIDMHGNRVLVRKNELNAFQFDAEDCPDLVPPLVALAANCRGKSTIYGIERLKHKESNRALTLAAEFAKMDIRISLSPNKMEVMGGTVKGDLVESHNDHRIAMACAIAALNATRPVVIENSMAIVKSYPRFFEDLDSIRVTK